MKNRINQKRLLNEFFLLTSIDAHSFQERKKADYLKKRLVDLDFSVIIEDEAGLEYGGNAGNIYARKEGSLDGSTLLFSAHMDTVAPGNGIKAFLDSDGRITSDGTTILGADDNSGLAAIIEAITIIKEDEIAHSTIELLLTIGEEAYLKGSNVFDYTQVHSKQAYVLDLSGKVGTAAIAAPTVLSFSIEVTGKSSHAGFNPEDGISAITISSNIITKIDQGRIDKDTTVNIGIIQGGISTNIVPEYCRIEGEVRSLSHEKALEQMNRVKNIVAHETNKIGGKYDIKTTTGCIAYNTPIESEVIKRFLDVCNKLEIESKLIPTLGGSDNNNFAHHGIEGIVVACAMEKVHSCQEYALLSELGVVTNIVFELMTYEK